MNKQIYNLLEKCREEIENLYGRNTELTDEITDMMDKFENQLTNGWIPVSERLPKEYKCVDGNDCYMMSEDILCSAYNEETGEYDMWIDYTIDGEWRTHEYYEGEKLAWQPLPPKYKEELE